jgi:hypothetical protein
MGSNMVLKTVSTLGGGGGGGGGTPGGANTTIQFNNAGAFGGSANLTWDGANVQVGSSGLFKLSNGVTNYVAFKAPTLISSNVTWTLPNTDGLPNQVLITNGSGVLSWATPTLTPTAPTNNTLPVVSGTPTVGETLSSTTGTWSGYPAPSYGYQWVRGASTNISGATSSAYQLVDADYNTTVKCTVTATNSAGSANATSAATATIAAGVPGAPTSVTAVGGNTQATISFTAPAITGGVAITSYTATSSPEGFTASGSASPLTVTGLTNGTSYTFTVTATNAIGTGPAGGPSSPVIPVATFPVEYLVVAGGGATAPQGGGGGAGGLLTNTGFVVTPGTNYTTTVGAGGTLSSTPAVRGTNGVNSVFSSITAIGGGAGGSQNAPANDGASGGSGGGGAVSGSGGAGGAGTSGQGNSGGTGTSSPNYGGGGGGGAGAVGGNGTTSVGGNGGSGATSTIAGSSTPTVYAGGGGGGVYTGGSSGGSGGSGGGGNGTVFGTSGNPGTANTGGGAGGPGGSTPPAGANGGSGVVVIAYPDTYPSLSSIGAGLTTQSWNGSAWVNNASGSTTPNTTIRSGYKVYRFSQGTGNIQW